MSLSRTCHARSCLSTTAPLVNERVDRSALSVASLIAHLRVLNWIVRESREMFTMAKLTEMKQIEQRGPLSVLSLVGGILGPHAT